MIVRWCKGLVHLIGGLAAGFAIAIVLLSWQLSRGPISLSFLTPYIEQALNSRHHNIFSLRLGDTILTWAGWERALDIRVLDVTALDPHGKPVATIPEVAFSLSGRALILKGQVAPKSVDLFGPRLLIRRDREGNFEFDVGGDLEGQLEGRSLGTGLLAQLLAEPASGSAMSYLTRLNIIGAETVIEDQILGRRWSAPSADIRLRRDDFGIKGEVTLQMDVAGRSSELVVVGGYRTEGRRLDLGISFSDLDPRTLAEFHHDLTAFRGIELPLEGTVTIGMAVDGPPEEIGFDLTGGAGTIQLPAFAPGLQGGTLDVASVALKGHYGGTDRTLEVKDLKIVARPGAEIPAPMAKGHKVPFGGLEFTGRYTFDRDLLEVDRLALDLDGPRVLASGRVDEASRRPDATIKVGLRDVDMKTLARYWPKAWAGDVRDWWVAHIIDGRVPRLDLTAGIRADEQGRVELDTLDGAMDIRGVTLSYMDSMPKVTGINGKANFTQKRFDVFVSSGKSHGLTVNKGQVFVTGLDTEKEYADIELDVAGPLKKAMTLVDHDPLSYAGRMGIEPKGISGDARVRLNIGFPMLLDMDPAKHLEISAEARLRGATVPSALHGFDLSNADLTLTVNRKGMDVKGNGMVASLPAKISWRENFAADAAFRTILDLSGRVVDIQQVRDLGLDVKFLSDTYVKGGFAADVRFTVLNERDTRVEVRADLEDTELKIDRIKWRKPLGAAGRAEMNLTIRGDKITRVPHFALYTTDMAVEGRAVIDSQTPELQRIDFTQVSYGRTEMKGALIRRADGTWDVGFHGPGLDLSPIWDELVGKGDDDGDDANFVLAAEFDKVWLGEERVLTDVSGTFDREDEIWRTILVRSVLNDKAALNITLKPGKDGNRTLDIHTADAGEVLGAFDFYENMKGGAMRILGTFQDSLPDHPLDGRLVIRDYRILKAPNLAHIVNIIGLTGILDALEGEGLGFAILDVPFEMRSGVVEISDARAAGTSLGFTASGNIYTYADVVDLDGTIVPAYVINSAFGRIPILGELFTGGEKGSGLFAANFKMSGPKEKPKISINPLSALAPGFLRQLFGIFGESTVDPAADVPEDPAPFQPVQ